MTPGIYPDMSREEYFAIEAANFSTLKNYAEPTALHAQWQIAHPKEQTDEMKLGTLCEMAIQCPEMLESSYVVMPDYTVGLVDPKGEPYANPRGTKKYKQLVSDFGRENAGKEFVKTEELQTAKRVAEAIASSKTASELLCGEGQNQVAIVWIDPLTGLLCKGLLDRLTTFNGSKCVVDLKCMSDASPGGFARQSANFCYHVQAWMYLAGLRELGEHVPNFYHVVPETIEPHGVAVYEMDRDSLAQGLVDFEKYITLHAECKRTSRYPGYVDGIEPLSLPRWRISRDI